MAAKIVVFVAALAACNAVPVLIEEESYVPGVIMRIGRSPNMAFGFGSGFASNIGGISHSSGMGASFQSGNAEAYAAGLGGNGNFARGVGIANAGPSSYPLGYQQAAPYGGLRNSFGSATSSAQNYGNYGSAVSSAQTHNGHRFGAASSAVNNGPRFQSAVSSVQNLRGLGYDSTLAAAQNNGMDFGSAVSAAENAGDYGSAMSAAQSHGNGNFGSAVSASQNIGGYRASTAQTMQHRAGALQHSGASSINAPGVQAAQSHAINNGYY